MDQTIQLIRRAREIFGDRWGEIEQMVQRDRMELYGWEEPPHLRAVVRRAIYERAADTAEADRLRFAVGDFARTAGEPARGEQREAVGELLEAGGVALDKIARYESPELTVAETLGLHCVVLLYGRPALLICDDRLANVPGFWNALDAQRAGVEAVARSVGRIALLGHPEFDWAGTGVLVGDNRVLTTYGIARTFLEPHGRRRWAFPTAVSAWMDFAATYQHQASSACRILSVLDMDELHGLAVLEAEPPPAAVLPLSLAAGEPPALAGRSAYLVGFPARDARRSEPERIARIFRDVYNVKRVQPGTICGLTGTGGNRLLEHDCAMLGRSNGSCLVDLETHQVLGLHIHGRYMEHGAATPLWTLRDRSLLGQSS